MRMNDTAAAKVKHHFSKQHLIAARLFSDLSEQAETKAGATEEDRRSHRAYVTGAVVFSVAFLEASINELYLQAVDGDRTALSGLTDQQTAVLAELWQTVEQRQLLSKYQIVLAACGARRFDQGAEPFQGTDALIKIRNALIHYRPEWDDDLDDHKKIRDRLGNRFGPNPFAGAGTLWFPHQCLGAGCATWSADQAALFMTDFCQRLNLPNRLP
jgi:hypothetical protein